MPIQITPAASLVNPITALITDVVAQGPGIAVATIQPNVVDNTKLAEMPTLTIKGNKEGVTGNPEDLTVAQVNAMLGATGGGHTIEQNGTPFTQRAALNFTGAGVTVTDDPGNSSTDVAITGGGSPRFAILTSSGTWTVPTGVTTVLAFVQGQGGYSGAGTIYNASPGAGGGGAGVLLVQKVSVSGSVSYTVPAVAYGAGPTVFGAVSAASGAIGVDNASGDTTGLPGASSWWGPGGAGAPLCGAGGAGGGYGAGGGGGGGSDGYG